MKTIPLTRGCVALVDDDDYERLADFKWQTTTDGHKKRFYAARTFRENGKARMVRMHRFILNALPGQEVDHVSGDTLDNRRANLRLCTRSGNQHNRGRNRNNRTGFKGVCWDRQVNKFKAQIMVNKKARSIGHFPTPEAAALAYNEAAIRLHGEYARLNIIPERAEAIA